MYHPPLPVGVKGLICKFRNNSVRCQYFTDISHADSVTTNKKHIKRDFDRRPVPDPLGGLREWGQNVKIRLFQNMLILHIKFKGIMNAAPW